MAEILIVKSSGYTFRSVRPPLFALLGFLAPALVSGQTMPTAPTNSYLFDQNLAPFHGSLTGSINGTVGYSSSSTPFSYSGDYSLSLTNAGDVSIGSLGLGAAGTISIWARDTSGSTAFRYVYDSSGPRFIYLQSGNPEVYVNGALAVSPGSNQVTSSWTHLAVTWTSGGSVTFYANGSVVGTGSVGSIGSSTQTFFIGSRQTSNEYWTGNIDEFASWNTTLSASNISWLATNSINAIPEPATTAAVLGALAVAGAMWKRRGRKQVAS